MPAPDGPLTSTRSPTLMVTSLAFTSGTPFGSRTLRSLKVTAAPSAGVTVITGGVAATARAAATDWSKPLSRSITARHSAIRR